MGRSVASRKRRVHDVTRRIVSGEVDHYRFCQIWEGDKPCGRPTARAARVGLSGSMCRRHQQHRQRHGSLWCKSPTAASLAVYIKAALSYIEVNRADLFIRAALDGLDALMSFSG